MRIAVLLLVPATLWSQRGKCDPERDPECFAWRMFAEIGAPQAKGDKEAGWEKWTSFSDLFNTHGVSPKCSNSRSGKQFIQTKEQPSLYEKGLHPQEVGFDTEIRYSLTACSEIRTSNIWSAAGLASAFNAGVVDLPQDPNLIVVKARWRPLGPKVCDSGQYRCYWDGHQWWALIAFHVASRALPNWFWATWEHRTFAKDDPYLRIDSFGRSGPKNSTSAKALKRLIYSAGMKRTWLNYWLVGTQTDYNKPKILANSFIEPPAGGQNSCMTCHARAAYGPDAPILAMADENGKGYVGEPCEGWYRPSGAKKRIPTDFLWTPLDSMIPKDGEGDRPSCK